MRGEVVGYVLTFDDISELVAAQRTAAWADVARRIAHEIKNPLTPIQLAAERLQRKYMKTIETDRDTFADCTNTIVRRVEDIRNMVDEFSAFARMPRPDFKPENLSHLVREAVFLEHNRSPGIEFKTVFPDERVELSCDSRQIAQALTNIIKNAAEAIVESGRGTRENDEPGRIWVTVSKSETADGDKRIEVIVEDNGKGLPAEQRDRLTEPYVTTRAKGTGLGLAIVKKSWRIMAQTLVWKIGKAAAPALDWCLPPWLPRRRLNRIVWLGIWQGRGLDETSRKPGPSLRKARPMRRLGQDNGQG